MVAKENRSITFCCIKTTILESITSLVIAKNFSSEPIIKANYKIWLQSNGTFLRVDCYIL